MTEQTQNMPVDQQVPLIWTSKGNLPIASLEYRTEWQVTEDSYVFVEEYWLDGECVKRSAHAFLPKGVLAEGAVGDF
jgi:hypothetical protein